MKVCHWAPFAPHRCGLYEAARDMVRADVLAGHDAYFCDVGVAEKGQRNQGEAEQLGGKKDDRGQWTLETAPWTESHRADLWVCHDGVPAWVAERNLVPIVWILHGRPHYAARCQQSGLGDCYSIIADLAQRPRVKAMVTMWPEHRGYWAHLVGPKLRVLESPPLDTSRYGVDGPVYEIPDAARGEVNILIADTWREDVDVFHVAHAAMMAAPRVGGRVHYWAVEEGPASRVYEHIWAAHRVDDTLGVVVGRSDAIDSAYRAYDLLVSPHRIATRTVIEAAACGLPVLAARGSWVAEWNADADDAGEMAATIVRAVGQLHERRSTIRTYARARVVDRCSLEIWSAGIDRVYKEAVGA